MSSDVCECGHLQVVHKSGTRCDAFGCNCVGFGDPHAKERRRYALLQAATVSYWEGVHAGVDDWGVTQALDVTEAILAEIERREKV